MDNRYVLIFQSKLRWQVRYNRYIARFGYFIFIDKSKCANWLLYRCKGFIPFEPLWLAAMSLFLEGRFNELLLCVLLLVCPPILLMLLEELELDVDLDRDLE